MGAPRVSVETADEFVKLGHQVDKFDIHDAFPNRNRLSAYFEAARFSHRAVEYVRRHGHNYDVIQAEQGNLPVTKQQLGYKGVLIARSNGLAHFHLAYLRAEQERKRRQGIREGTVIGNLLRGLAERTYDPLAEVERSFVAADAIIMINQAEWQYVSENLGHRDKTVLLNNAMSEERHAAFAARRTPPAARLAAQQISFIGGWTDLKGSRDFPRLVRAVRKARPGTRFLLLGTGVEANTVRSCFDQADRDAVEVVARYASADLPELLSTATIGVQLSYSEGFGLGILESLAAGIPTLAYDAPGPREMLRRFEPPLLTPVGDVETAAQRLLTLLALSENEYTALSKQSCMIASHFRWPDIACKMLALYEQKRTELGLNR